MKEIEIHWLWNSGRLRQQELVCSEGERIRILFPGIHNHGPGPDFKNARIKFGDINLAGDVEIHINSSDWFRHKHDRDENYNAVILHLVLNHDKDAKLKTGLIPRHLIINSNWFNITSSSSTPKKLVCLGELKRVPDRIVKEWLNELFIRRKQDKIAELKRDFNLGASHICILYKLIFRAAGFKTHSSALLKVFNLYDFYIWKNESEHPENILFLLLFALNLQSASNNYTQEYLEQKYRIKLKKIAHKITAFYRPNNSILNRSYQLVFIIYLVNKEVINLDKNLSKEELSNIIDSEKKKFCQRLKISSNKIGKVAVYNIWDNSLYWYFIWINGPDNFKFMSDKLEENKVVNKFKKYLNLNTRQQGQALLFLHENYCSRYKCLNCTFGKYLFKN